MTHRILFVVGALLFLSLIEAVYAADLVTLRYGQNAASAVELERIQSRAHAHG